MPSQKQVLATNLQSKLLKCTTQAMEILFLYLSLLSWIYYYSYIICVIELRFCEKYSKTVNIKSIPQIFYQQIWLFMSIISGIINTLSNFIELLIVNNMTDFMLQFNELSLHIVTWFEIEMNWGKEIFYYSVAWKFRMWHEVRFIVGFWLGNAIFKVKFQNKFFDGLYLNFENFWSLKIWSSRNF